MLCSASLIGLAIFIRLRELLSIALFAMLSGARRGEIFVNEITHLHGRRHGLEELRILESKVHLYQGLNTEGNKTIVDNREHIRKKKKIGDQGNKKIRRTGKQTNLL